MNPDPGHRLVRIILALGAVLFQIGLAFYYVGLPILVVPGPAIYALWLAWAIEVVVVIWLAIRRPVIAPIVPLVSLVLVLLVLEYGDANLGWGA